MRRLWKPFIRMPCSTSQCCGREKLHFFSTAKYMYSPLNNREIGAFSIVRQNGNELFKIFLSSTLAGQVNHWKDARQSSSKCQLTCYKILQNYKICLWNLQILPENFLYADTTYSRKQGCNIAEISNMISSLIFCFVVGAVLAAEEDSRSAYIKTQENKRLHGYVVKRIDSTDEMSCSKACLRHSWCTSSNFKESSGNCELNKHEFSTTDDNTKLTDNPGTTFSMFLKVRKVLNFHCLDNKGVRVQTSLISACKKK